MVEVLEDFVGLFYFTSVLSDAVDAIQILGRIAHCVARVFVIFTRRDDLPDEWVFEDTISESLMMNSFDYSVLVGSWKLEYFEYIEP